MFSRFFIYRPIFSSVISLLIFIAGVVTMLQLPVAQFPEIVPPVVEVSTAYAGADALTLVETVAVPIETQMNGVDNMIYMTSTCSNSGSYQLNVYFELGTDPDINTVNVNNKVSLATARLPEEVKLNSVSVKKRSTNILGFYSFSLNEKFRGIKDDLYLANYVSMNVKDRLGRIHGVGDANLMDSRNFSMRLWLNPQVMAERNVSISEITQMIKEQNIQVASGSVGTMPSPEGQLQTLSLVTKGRLNTLEEFENLVVRTSEDGSVLKVKDLAVIELGGDSYSVNSYNTSMKPLPDELEELKKHDPSLRDVVSVEKCIPSATIAMYLQPGKNALEVTSKINAELKSMEEDLRMAGIDYVCAYDSTIFIEVSLEEVYFTLLLTIGIVVAVVYIFLQDWRAALIPCMTIPISLVGTFFMMGLFGFSINTLTLLGLILVIGIVVDDAIVVVENCQRLIDEENLSAVDAAVQSMIQVSGPIVATTCVLLSVFLPTMFVTGMVGILYQQFALTIAGAVVLSAVCALTMSPALCAIFLRKSKKDEEKNFFFRWFNYGFMGFSHVYKTTLHFLVHHVSVILLFWVFLVMAVVWGFQVMKQGFIPNEDQGVLFLDIRLPDGRSLPETDKICLQVDELLREKFGDCIKNAHYLSGYSMIDSTSSTNTALGILSLRDWKYRTEPSKQSDKLAQRIMIGLSEHVQGARVLAFSPPPISGLGTSGSLEGQLIDTNERGVLTLYHATQTLSDIGPESGVFSRVSSTFNPFYPMITLDIDREKAKKMGLNLTNIFGSIQGFFGSQYVNDFNIYGRVFQVIIQAEENQRAHYEDVLKLPIMDAQGNKMPLGAIATLKERTGPQFLNRYNLYTTTQIMADPALGESSGSGIAGMENLVKEQLPEGFQVEWTGMAYQQSLAGATVMTVFILSLIFGFLVLAAQYESWSAPLIIMMAVPLGVSGAMLAVFCSGLDINLYTQIGFILMVGLSAKNAILITEYARDEHLKSGHGIVKSAVLAGTMRLRPIMMTSYAFILGVLPLMFATGAGANSRIAIGTAVFGGMFEETMVGILVSPVLFVVITGMAEASMKVIRKIIGIAEPDMGEIQGKEAV